MRAFSEAEKKALAKLDTIFDKLKVYDGWVGFDEVESKNIGFALAAILTGVGVDNQLDYSLYREDEPAKTQGQEIRDLWKEVEELAYSEIPPVRFYSVIKKSKMHEHGFTEDLKHFLDLYDVGNAADVTHLNEHRKPDSKASNKTSTAKSADLMQLDDYRNRNGKDYDQSYSDMHAMAWGFNQTQQHALNLLNRIADDLYHYGGFDGFDEVEIKNIGHSLAAIISTVGIDRQIDYRLVYDDVEKDEGGRKIFDLWRRVQSLAWEEMTIVEFMDVIDASDLSALEVMDYLLSYIEEYMKLRFDLE